MERRDPRLPRGLIDWGMSSGSFALFPLALSPPPPLNSMLPLGLSHFASSSKSTGLCKNKTFVLQSFSGAQRVCAPQNARENGRRILSQENLFCFLFFNGKKKKKKKKTDDETVETRIVGTVVYLSPGRPVRYCTARRAAKRPARARRFRSANDAATTTRILERRRGGGGDGGAGAVGADETLGSRRRRGRIRRRRNRIPTSRTSGDGRMSSLDPRRY